MDDDANTVYHSMYQFLIPSVETSEGYDDDDAELSPIAAARSRHAPVKLSGICCGWYFH